MYIKGVKWRVGDWIALPLTDTGWAVARICYVSKRAFFLGYFYRHRYETMPSLEELEELLPEQADIIARVYTYGIKIGDWKVLGATRNGSKYHWAIPYFGSVDPTYPRTGQKRTYSSADISVNGMVQTTVSFEEALSLQRDGVWSHTGLAEVLTDYANGEFDTYKKAILARREEWLREHPMS